MNYPVGKVVEKNSLPSDFSSLLLRLENQRFNGYIVQSVKGSSFVEEGVLFIRDGFSSACIVECLLAKKTFKGSSALDYFFNQTKGNGYYQLVELTRTQIDLINAFDEEILLPKPLPAKDASNFVPTNYAERFSSSYNSNAVFESYGLRDLK